MTFVMVSLSNPSALFSSSRMSALKLRFFVALAAAFACAGCAHTARHYSAPDSVAMVKSGRQLSAAVKAARANAEAATASVKAAGKQSAAQSETLTTTAQKLADLFRLSPPELRPLVAEVQSQVAALESGQEQEDEELAAANDQLYQENAQLSAATAADAQHLAEQTKYIAEANAITARANTAEAGWAADSQKLAWYRLHWWGAWIALGTGLLAIAAFAFLKFTGRLAISGAAIAAKL